MGWSLSPYYFTTFTMTFVKHLRSPYPRCAWQCPAGRWLRAGVEGSAHLTIRRRFLAFASSEPEALELRQRVADLLTAWACSATQRAVGAVARLAIPAARFYLRELHDVVGSKWGGRPTSASTSPGKNEGRPVAVESFLPHLAGRRVLLHEDNQAACNVLAGLTSRSPEMMAELRKLWYLLDSNGVHIRARYIRSAANVWADRLSRHLDSDDWQLDPVLFKLEAMW
eukprot:jgi/Tetstr1/459758/TSEL_005111.t1